MAKRRGNKEIKRKERKRERENDTKKSIDRRLLSISRAARDPLLLENWPDKRIRGRVTAEK